MTHCPLPANQHDVSTAAALVIYPHAVSPKKQRLLLNWLKDSSWAVFPFVVQFFIQQGSAATPAIVYALRSNNGVWKKHLVQHVLSTWPREDLAALGSSLTSLVTNSDLFGPGVVAAQLLLKHQLVDENWLRRWLEFQHNALSGKLVDITDLMQQLEPQPLSCRQTHSRDR